MAQYKILKDDCLSLLAQRFNTSPEILMGLNSEQIKNPDLIYEGDTLTLPDPAIESIPLDGSRIALPAAPKKPAGGEDTCSSPIDYADILYVPAHPKTGKKAWYALTDEAKKILESEKAILDSMVVEGDVTTTTQNLNKLGVLSKFASKNFEQFMKPNEAEEYKTLCLFKWVITRYAYKAPDSNPFNVLHDMAEKANIEMGGLKRKVKHWKSHVERIQSYYEQQDAMQQKMEMARLGIDGVSGASVNTAQVEQAKQTKVDQYVLDQLHNVVLDQVNDKLEDLEKSAIRLAEDIKATDDTYFTYKEELNYFTSEQQLSIQKNTKLLAIGRYELGIAQQPHDKALARIKELIDLATRTYGMNWYSVRLGALNRLGFVVKEQCLTLEQLEGSGEHQQGPAILNSVMPNWREKGQVIDITKDIGKDKDSFIRQLYLDTKGGQGLEANEALVNDVTLNWSYYPSLALIALIDATVIKHQQNLNQIFKASLPVDDLFNQLLWVKKVAKARIEFLKKIAQKRLDNLNPSLEFTIPSVAALPAKLNLLWDNAYKPKPKNKPGFINQAKLNDLQVVECSLMSTGEVFYVRGPAWYMPESNSHDLCTQAGGHVRNITEKITFSDAKVKAENVKANKQLALAKALEELSNPQLQELTIEANFNSTFWSDGYHYQGGVSPDGNGAQYSADVGAQLFRFSSKAAATLNTPLSDYQKLIENPKQLGASGEISANISVLQAQANFMFWLPFEKSNQGKKDIKEVAGYNFNLGYQNARNYRLEYPVGCLAAKIEGSVFGMAGASCQLSGKVAFGASDVGSGNFGIKGSSVTAFDPNIQRVNVLTEGPVSANVAAEAGFKADVFAGVEAGGSLGATVYWQPSKQKKADDEQPNKDTNSSRNDEPWQKLGSINGELSVAYGAGGQADFRLVFQGGVLVVVAAAKWVMGPGASGKLAINLDMLGVDRFVDTLLGVFKMHDFKRLDVFGDVDSEGKNEHFTQLNNVLTMAVALGLSVADVLLMPTSVWANYQQIKLGREYAPFLATNILRADKQAIMKPWVTKLPPETLCNLFNCLTLEQDKPIRSSGGREIFTIDESNQRLAQGIVQIMQWLVEDEKSGKGEKNEGEISSKRQWKESLIRMNDDPAILKDKPFPRCQDSCPNLRSPKNPAMEG